MSATGFPTIDLTATGDNIRRLRLERGLTVKDLQNFFGFEEPRAIYKWQKGECLPTVDNLYALGRLLGVPMDRILIPAAEIPHIASEQQAEPCCSILFRAVALCLGLSSRYSGKPATSVASFRFMQFTPLSELFSYINNTTLFLIFQVNRSFTRLPKHTLHSPGALEKSRFPRLYRPSFLQ